MKVIVFDIGSTLMEYVGMPPSWVDYYKQGFEAVNVNELIFVGDEEKDRKTAENAPCRFIHINRSEKISGSICNLEELTVLL